MPIHAVLLLIVWSVPTVLGAPQLQGPLSCTPLTGRTALNRAYVLFLR